MSRFVTTAGVNVSIADEDDHHLHRLYFTPSQPASRPEVTTTPAPKVFELTEVVTTSAPDLVSPPSDKKAIAAPATTSTQVQPDRARREETPTGQIRRQRATDPFYRP